MSYSFQSISSGVMLSSTFINKIETNIMEHQHGINSITNLYGGNWTSVVTNASTAVAHKFDTTETFVASGSKLLSVCNSGTEKFGIYHDGNFAMTKVVAYSTGIQSIADATITAVQINTKTLDILNEFNVSSSIFTAVNTGYYEVLGKITCGVTSTYVGLQLWTYTALGGDNDKTFLRVNSGYTSSVQHARLWKLDANATILLQVEHDAGTNLNISSMSTFTVKRVL